MSNIKGIEKMYKKNNDIYYRASITYKNKHISLGSYDTIEQAHNAYNEAYELLFNHKHTIIDYLNSMTLPFDKWVILLNYRDNHYYIGNPIYLYKSYFCYYLSEKIEFKFSTEDLFFYATHKINYRNGYYYINDHGEQINLLARYHIKNYAVLNKDYRFKNGDVYDFRPLNIEIINPYNGVTSLLKDNKQMYTTTIFTDNTLLVGVYTSEIEAAIAYNKAIDLLYNHGIDKRQNKNYIYELSSQEYKKLYKEIKISTNLITRSKQKRPIRFLEYSGVYKQATGYRAYIGYQYKHIYLGMYPTELQAAQAYNQAALILYGNAANLNHTLPTVNIHNYDKILQKISKVFPQINGISNQKI